MIWHRLFRSQEQPQSGVEHPVLGPLIWEPHEREWRGTYNGFAFSIAQEKLPTPTPELLDYAMALFAAPQQLLQQLETEKRQWISKYPASAEEVEPLRFEEFALYRRKGKGVCRAFVILAPEYDRNAWRIEFEECICRGLGFDS